ncbi:hypothetical protein GOP47_0004667 [Adiantum capillus-veneris]|uniref:Uncharacterized protein n=1 Tax=Adiantum capillus-veneris TaxID=13818 RepID=A0A9D4V8I6_ADICA|nr:hypothetical protein GOP47_0004667 [Adiantum capillus-veneris]
MMRGENQEGIQCLYSPGTPHNVEFQHLNTTENTIRKCLRNSMKNPPKRAYTWNQQKQISRARSWARVDNFRTLICKKQSLDEKDMTSPARCLWTIAYDQPPFKQPLASYFYVLSALIPNTQRATPSSVYVGLLIQPVRYKLLKLYLLVHVHSHKHR